MRALDYLGLGPSCATEDDSSPAAPLVRAVVPADTERSLIAEVIDSLGLVDLEGAWNAIVERVRHERTEEKAREAADAVLASVVHAFESAGCTVEGSVSEDDPIPAIRALLDEGSTSQTVVVFSDPQLLEETFAQDWAHRVEDHLDVTVLHLYPGSEWIGTS